MSRLDAMQVFSHASMVVRTAAKLGGPVDDWEIANLLSRLYCYNFLNRTLHRCLKALNGNLLVAVWFSE